MSLFDDDIQLNEHQIAWYASDLDSVQKCADQFKQKADDEFFEILGAINEKKSLTLGQRSYSKHMVEHALSQHPDCLPAVYVMNLVGSGLSDESHFRYMVASVPHGRRYGKWAKLNEDSTDALVVTVLSAYYQVNKYDAMEYVKILRRKNKLKDVLHQARSLVSDELIKTITKNVKEQKQLKKLALEW